jgi:hypothetical protein
LGGNEISFPSNRFSLSVNKKKNSFTRQPVVLKKC